MQNRYSPTILLLYSSRFGQCQRIAETVAKQLEPLGHQCDVFNIEEKLDLPKPVAEYDAVVVTASIRYGYYHKKVGHFIRDHLEALKETLDVFIPVNLIARNPERRTIKTNSYVEKFLAKTNWEPELLSIMPGALRYTQYNAIDRTMIRMIMKMTKGDTDTSKDVDYTDWEEVRAFARCIDKNLREKRLNLLFPKQKHPQLGFSKESDEKSLTEVSNNKVESNLTPQV